MSGLAYTGELLDANINRSPSAYLNNPPEEQSRYRYDVDKEMTLLKFVDEEWGPIGSFNWFAVHGTSMSRFNRLISGDNKGTAARLMEDWYDRDRVLQGVLLLMICLQMSSLVIYFHFFLFFIYEGFPRM